MAFIFKSQQLNKNKYNTNYNLLNYMTQGHRHRHNNTREEYDLRNILPSGGRV